MLLELLYLGSDIFRYNSRFRILLMGSGIPDLEQIWMETFLTCRRRLCCALPVYYLLSISGVSSNAS